MQVESSPPSISTKLNGSGRIKAVSGDISPGVQARFCADKFETNRLVNRKIVKILYMIIVFFELH